MSFRLSALGNALVVGGALVGAATVAAVATGAEINLSPAMIQLLIYKGLAVASIGLIVAGSWVGRRGRQQERDSIAGMKRAELAVGASAPYNDNSAVSGPVQEKVNVRNSTDSKAL